MACISKGLYSQAPLQQGTVMWLFLGHWEMGSNDDYNFQITFLLGIPSSLFPNPIALNAATVLIR